MGSPIRVYGIWEPGEERSVYYRTLGEARRDVRASLEPGDQIVIEEYTIAGPPNRALMVKLLNGEGWCRSDRPIERWVSRTCLDRGINTPCEACGSPDELGPCTRPVIRRVEV